MMGSFYTQYLNIVGSADSLLTRPAVIKSETKCEVQDVELYCSHLSSCIPSLQSYPSLLDSLYALIDKEEMTGHLGVYIIDNALIKCDEFCHLEDEIHSEIERVLEVRSDSDKVLLNSISEKAKTWHRIVSVENLKFVGEYLLSLKQQVDRFFDSLSAQERLGKALAQSEEERKKLLEQEEARRRGITEQELDKEEKRRKAREEYAKKIKTRKKK